MSAQWGKEARHTIDGKHPDRGFACQFVVVLSQGAQTGKKDFHTPSGRAAREKIVFHKDKYGKGW